MGRVENGQRKSPGSGAAFDVDFMKNEEKDTNNLHQMFVIVIIPLELEAAL